MKPDQKLVCRICTNSNNNKTYVAKEMMFGLRHEFSYFQCSKCHCLQIVKVPEDISRYYSSEIYYSFKNKALHRYSGFKGYVKINAVKQALLNKSKLLRFLSFALPLKTIGILKDVVTNTSDSILDVGCGTGWNFLYPLYKAGFRNCAGCDPYIEKDIVYPEGLTIYRKNIMDMEGEWDVITFHHSFEHIGNPHETLKKTYDLLKPGGYCIIRIPTVSSFAWKHYGVNWFQLDAPRHIFLHSTDSMKYLALKAGFYIGRIRYDSTHHQFTISERYKRGLAYTENSYKNIFHSISTLFRKLRYKIKARQLNRNAQGDQLVLFLQKYNLITRQI